MAVLDVRDIKLSYGITDILTSVSFTVNKGDKIGVAGVNGAGKTSLLSIICGTLTLLQETYMFLKIPLSVFFASRRKTISAKKQYTSMRFLRFQNSLKQSGSLTPFLQSFQAAKNTL